VGNSIQDQLLKAGLGSKKQAVKARKAQHNKQKLKATGVEVVDEAEALAKEAAQQKTERDRELNRQKNQLAEQKAIQAQIKELIKLNRISERGDTEFSFTDGSTVKSLLLQSAHRQQLVSGKLTIVKLDDNYDVVPRPVAEKIAERDESVVVVKNEQAAGEAGDEQDDEYADYQVPDDLMW